MKAAALYMILLVGAYQNCSRVDTPSPNRTEGSETIIGLTSAYSRVEYDPMLEMGGSNQKLEVDVGGGLKIGGKSCALDSIRRQRLVDIFSHSRICQPAPLPPGTAVCLALGLADTRLSNASQSIVLRPVVCHNGTYLCDGFDGQLRNLILELIQNPPSGC